MTRFAGFGNLGVGRTLGSDVAKKILIFSDGTGQAGGLRPDQRLSNIYKLYRATRPGADSPIDPAKQVAYYDPGLGTSTEQGGIRLSILDKVLSAFGLVTGLGITDNIIDCYTAILKHYQPGDRVYLFGFSRGAYTARCVAGVLRLCGIPTTDGAGNALPPHGPRLRAIAKEAVSGVYERRFASDSQERLSARESAAIRFREKYRSQGTDPDCSNVAPAFVGVFDTVAALGAKGMRLVGLALGIVILTAVFSALVSRVASLVVPIVSFWWAAGGTFLVGGTWLAFKLSRARWKGRNYDLSLDPRTGYARHARAIDESRKDFDVLGWGHSSDVQTQWRENGPWLVQLWFAGCHSDIGGSYEEDESRLSDIALQWMTAEVQKCAPILIDESKLQLWPSHAGMQHCEVQASREQWWRPTWLEQDRVIPDGAPLHESVLNRFALAQVPHFRHAGPYRPRALRSHAAVKHYYQ
jgi:uncharacterized protein (DUF2235 family)